MNARRALWTWVLACAAGAGLVLLAAGREWATVRAGSIGGSSQVVSVQGDRLAPFLSPVALAALAAVVALLATRGVARRAVGVVVALCGLGAIAGVRTGTRMTAITDALSGQAGLAMTSGGASSAAVAWTWPAVAASGGLLLLAAGAAAALRGHRWPGMSDRYDRTGPSSGGAVSGSARGAERGPVSERALWDAIDRGADPTAGPRDGEG
ncbi:Trp biosynthesis-associated membrane protein [Planobispora siamensis]|uniref:Tryptophan-associated transmembrane protein (Trp_oprn_chp) n=1 Tax=Planobispora siamensis TaxID=936338 RepID=A0A8J3SSU3_9ACTN|nr:Trp biosynthesis-associated membrane protein [Planobispora siamensis]GIH94978.1 hypothetical protein Psi01_56080 [Planobispora siamensis]